MLSSFWEHGNPALFPNWVYCKNTSPICPNTTYNMIVWNFTFQIKWPIVKMSSHLCLGKPREHLYQVTNFRWGHKWVHYLLMVGFCGLPSLYLSVCLGLSKYNLSYCWLFLTVFVTPPLLLESSRWILKCNFPVSSMIYVCDSSEYLKLALSLNQSCCRLLFC